MDENAEWEKDGTVCGCLCKDVIGPRTYIYTHSHANNNETELFSYVCSDIQLSSKFEATSHLCRCEPRALTLS